MKISTVPLRSQPGIKRDGTLFEGDAYVDGRWCRFQRGLPRKIGGYKSTVKTLGEASRGFHNFVQEQLAYFHSGSAARLERFTLDQNQISTLITNRTPLGLTADERNKWMFVTQFDSSLLTTQLVAHVAPNNGPPNNAVGGEIYSGDVTGTSPLAAVTLPAGANATGGVVSLHPYLFYYGSNGIIGWSAPGRTTDLTGMGSGVARPWGQKIIKGMPLRGNGAGPSGIFWAYDAVIRATFTGGDTVFGFDTLATDTSIMSPDSVIDFDGVFYWVGVDRFLSFNGVVREVPNQINLNWFFDGINPEHTSKVFAFKVTRFGEIWWCYPRGDAVECTHAIIYNVREQSWYDTELPKDQRTAGGFCNLFAAPVLVSNNEANSFKVWVHEQGVDAIDGQSLMPIQSFFETADLSQQIIKGSMEKLQITRIEPDFVQTGPMTVTVRGRANARAPEVVGEAVVFDQEANEPFEEVVNFKEERRQLRVRFESNTVGGNYQTGQVLGHFRDGDESVLS